MEHQPPSPGPPASVLTALRRLLRPLVRGLLDQRVSYPVLARLLKEIFVEVADQDFPLEGRAQTTTRISLLTGLHRKEVKQLREAPASLEPQHGQEALGALIVARWTGEPAYLDDAQQPLPLPRQAPPGEPSFSALVESVSTDIRPRAVLDEWLRLGVAHLDAEERVHLEAQAFIPDSGFDEKAFFFGRNTRDHLAAATHNLRGESPAMPDRAVYYGGLTEAAADRLAALAEEVGMEALQRVNREAATRKRQDAEDGLEPSERITLGFYFYRGPEEAEDESNDS